MNTTGLLPGMILAIIFWGWVYFTRHKEIARMEQWIRKKTAPESIRERSHDRGKEY